MTIVLFDATGVEVGRGTGFIVSEDGILVTNHHVIRNAYRAVAKTESGRQFSVDGVLASDSAKDIVILKLRDAALPSLRLGNSEKVVSGMKVFVIGSPLGILEGTVTQGIVSAVRNPPIVNHRLLQIDAAISPGSSGSPVLNETGEVIGVARFFALKGQLLNFAVPVEDVKELLAQARRTNSPDPLAKYAEPEAPPEVREPEEEPSVSGTTPDADIWANRALVHAKAQRWDEAAAAFRRAAELETRQKSAAAIWWSLAGEMYRRAGHLSAAISHLEYAVIVDAKNGYCWYFLCAGYIEAARQTRREKWTGESNYEHNKRVQKAIDAAQRAWRTLNMLDPDRATELLPHLQDIR